MQREGDLDQIRFLDNVATRQTGGSQDAKGNRIEGAVPEEDSPEEARGVQDRQVSAEVPDA